MSVDQKHFFKKWAGVFALLYFLLFMAYYLSALLIESDFVVNVLIEYTVTAMQSAAIGLTGAMIYLSLSLLPRKRALCGSYFWMLGRMFYLLPYHYIYYVLADGYDSFEAVLLALATGALETTVLYILYALLSLLLVRGKRRRGDAEEAEQQTKAFHLLLISSIHPIYLFIREAVYLCLDLIEYFYYFSAEDIFGYFIRLFLPVATTALTFWISKTFYKLFFTKKENLSC